MPISEETLTTFLRDPNSIIERLRREDVILKRRDGDALRLSLATRSSQDFSYVEIAARLLGGMLSRMPAANDVLLDTLQGTMPWIRFLPPAARTDFARELLEAIEAGASVGTTAPFAEVLAAWKSTAAVYADPSLAAELTRPASGTDLAVKRP